MAEPVRRWENRNITLSVVPDGTELNTHSEPYTAKSNLTKFYTLAGIERQVVRSAKVWAAICNISFKLVKDDGSPMGVEGMGQGDPRFGDIRVFGHSDPTGAAAHAYYPHPGTTMSGDIVLNTDHRYPGVEIGALMLHELGHSLGLGHTETSKAVMGWYYDYPVLKLYAEDIKRIRVLYGKRP